MKKMIILLLLAIWFAGCSLAPVRGCQNCSEQKVYDKEYRLKYIIKTTPQTGTTIYDKNYRRVGKIK